MRVYEIKLKMYLLEKIHLRNILEEIGKFISSSLCEEKLEFHKENKFKNYCYNYPYPLAMNSEKTYEEGQVYTLTIRTIDEELANYFTYKTSNFFNSKIKGLVATKRVLPKNIITTLYSITPIIIRTEDQKYWRENNKTIQFENNITNNLNNKIKTYYKETNKDKFNSEIYNSIKFLNIKPIGTTYKTKTLLGDKIQINIKEDVLSQEASYFALGTGLGLNNSSGFGFLNYKEIRI